MLEGWKLKDEEEWERVRFQCYYAANTMYWAGPTKDIRSIMQLPTVDGEETTESLKDKIIRKQKELSLLK